MQVCRFCNSPKLSLLSFLRATRSLQLQSKHNKTVPSSDVGRSAAKLEADSEFFNRIELVTEPAMGKIHIGEMAVRRGQRNIGFTARTDISVYKSIFDLASIDAAPAQPRNGDTLCCKLDLSGLDLTVPGLWEVFNSVVAEHVQSRINEVRFVSN